MNIHYLRTLREVFDGHWTESTVWIVHNVGRFFACCCNVWLTNATFLPQAMDLYYHNDSDPDSYRCPGDSSKSPAFLYNLCTVLLYPSFYPRKDRPLQSFTPWLSFALLSPSVVLGHPSLSCAVLFVFTIIPNSPLFVSYLLFCRDGCGSKSIRPAALTSPF